MNYSKPKYSNYQQESKYYMEVFILKRNKSYLNETYHIINKGVNSMVIFRNDDDKIFFSNLIKKYAQKNSIVIYAYALMDNHYHLCVSSKLLNFSDISKFMKGINSCYVRYFNKTDGVDKEGNMRVGTIFQSTYKSIPVNSKYQLKYLVSYIHNNPVSIKDVDIETYEWSSYRRYLAVLSGKVSPKKDKENIIQVDMSEFIDLTELEFKNMTKACKKNSFAACEGLYNGKYYLSDTILSGEVENQFGFKPSKIQTMDYISQGMYLYMITQIHGASSKQIARITGMNHSQMCTTIKDYKEYISLRVDTEVKKYIKENKNSEQQYNVEEVTRLVIEALKNIKSCIA